MAGFDESSIECAHAHFPWCMHASVIFKSVYFWTHNKHLSKAKQTRIDSPNCRVERSAFVKMIKHIGILSNPF